MMSMTQGTCCGSAGNSANDMVEVSAPLGTITYSHASNRYLLEFGTTVLCFTAEAFDEFAMFVETIDENAYVSDAGMQERSIVIACGSDGDIAQPASPRRSSARSGSRGRSAGGRATGSGRTTGTRHAGMQPAGGTWPSAFGVMLSPHEFSELRRLVLSITIEVIRRFE